jgi:hypothetical protein
MVAWVDIFCVRPVRTSSHTCHATVSFASRLDGVARGRDHCLILQSSLYIFIVFCNLRASTNSTRGCSISYSYCICTNGRGETGSLVLSPSLHDNAPALTSSSELATLYPSRTLTIVLHVAYPHSSNTDCTSLFYQSNSALQQIALHSLTFRMPDNNNDAPSTRLAAHLHALHAENPDEVINDTFASLRTQINRLRLELQRGLEALVAFQSTSNPRVGASVLSQSNSMDSPPSGRPAGFPYVPQSSRLTPPAGFSYVSENPFGVASGGLGSAAPQRPSTLRSNTIKGPVVTLVSTLPPTTYKEQDDSKSSLNTLAYIRVQRALLRYLENHSADSLTPRQARKWTEEIDPAANKDPKTADALRLCYYMRSQGYDVFGLVKSGAILLYCRILGGDQDVLYWKQNFATNQVEYAAPASQRAPRRNAVVDAGSGMADYEAGLRRQAEQSADLAAAEIRLQVELGRQPSDTA